MNHTPHTCQQQLLELTTKKCVMAIFSLWLNVKSTTDRYTKNRSRLLLYCCLLSYDNLSLYKLYWFRAGMARLTLREFKYKARFEPAAFCSTCKSPNHYTTDVVAAANHYRYLIDCKNMLH